MRTRRLRFALFTAAALAALAAVAPATPAGASSPRAHAQRLPLLADGDGHAKIRPTTIQYTGDGSGVIGRLPSGGFHRVIGQRPGFLHWTAWTSTRAAATGTVWLLSCKPDCAGSPFYRYALTLTVGRVRHGHFTRMTLHYRYQGHAVSDTRCVRDRPPARIWGLILNGRCE